MGLDTEGVDINDPGGNSGFEVPGPDGSGSNLVDIETTVGGQGTSGSDQAAVGTDLSPIGDTNQDTSTMSLSSGGGTTTPSGGLPPVNPIDVPSAVGFGGYVANPGISQDYSDIFAPVTKGLASASEGIQGAVDAFNLGAGERRESWGEFVSTLDQGANLGGQYIQPATDLVNARYEGPANLEAALPDQGDIADIVAQLEDLRFRSSAYTEAGGLQTLLSELYPSLNQGQLAFESKSLRAQPGFKESAGFLQSDITKLMNALGLSRDQATSYGEARLGDEQQISDLSTGYLEDRQGAIWDALGLEAENQKAEYDANIAAKNQFASTGSFEDLAKIDPSVLRGLSDENVDIDALAKGQADRRALTDEASGVRQGIMDEYQQYFGDDEVPMMVPGVNSHGRMRFELPAEWWNEAKNRYSPEDLNAIKMNALSRHKALAEAGFANADLNYQTPDLSFNVEKGKFADVSPLWFDKELGEFQSQMDPRNYVASFDPGVSPTRQNVSTEEQRKIYNNINEIFEITNADLKTPEVAMRKAKMIMDANNYLKDEEAELQRRQGALSESQENWMGYVNRLRRHYKKQESWKNFNNVTGIVMNVATAGQVVLADETIGEFYRPGIEKLGKKPVPEPDAAGIQPQGSNA